MVSEGFWLHFWINSYRCLEVFFGSFPDFAEKAAPHESTANSGQIEARAPEKGRKNHPKSE